MNTTQGLGSIRVRIPIDQEAVKIESTGAAVRQQVEWLIQVAELS
jgi:hypothetical protein